MSASPADEAEEQPQAEYRHRKRKAENRRASTPMPSGANDMCTQRLRPAMSESVRMLVSKRLAFRCSVKRGPVRGLQLHLCAGLVALGLRL